MSLLVGFKAGFQLKYLFRKSWISSCRLLAGLSHHVVPGSGATPFTDKPSFFAPQWNIFQIKASGGRFELSPYTRAKNLVITERHNLYSRLSILSRELCLTSKCDQYLSSKIFCKNTPGDESVNQNPNKALSGSDPYHGWGLSLGGLGGGEGRGSTLIYVIWLWLQMRCAFKQTQTQIRWA